MGTDAFEGQLAALKTALGAASDSDLASKLGLTRYAVSKWRINRVLPPRYRFVIDDHAVDGVSAAMQFIFHQEIYKHPDNHFWLQAALHMLGTSEASDRTPAQTERLLTRLMGFAAGVTRSDLGKARCEGRGDFNELIGALASEGHRDRRARIFFEEAEKATPQSDSSIGLNAANSQ